MLSVHGWTFVEVNGDAATESEARSIFSVLFVLGADVATLGEGAVGETAVRIFTKADLPFVEAFARGILCNALVCLALCLATGARSVADKILAVVFPITAFVSKAPSFGSFCLR